MLEGLEMVMEESRLVAFAGETLVAKGDAEQVAMAAKRLVDARDQRALLIYDAETSRPVEIDFRGSEEDVRARLRSAIKEQPEAGESASTSDEAPRRGPGRPKLGVVAREVTLLPRHWDWLASQPGGASVTLRKLVEAARRESAGADRIREARDSVYHFASALAGDAPGYEDAMRALYANDRTGFIECSQQWPTDVRDHARELAEAAFASEE